MFIKYIITTVVFLSLFFVNMQAAQASNAILNTSLRKTAADSLNFTFFTKGDNSEKPIVKNKGNNQYVILLPNLMDSSGSKPDLRAVSDMVSDVNIKTINEGAVTYTKISVTTKKPVKINAETRKTTQSASELSGVNDIVSRVSLINQDIAASKNIQPVSVQPKVQTPKLNSVQDILNNKNSLGNTKPAVDIKPEKASVVVPPAAPVKTVAAHVPANTKSIKAESKNLKNENIKNIRNDAVKNIDKIEQNIKKSVENNVTVNDEEITETILPPLNDTAVSDTKIDEDMPLESSFSLLKFLSSPAFLITLLGLAALILVSFIISRMKSVLADTQDMNNSFIERMNSSIPSTKKDYSHIAKDENLNWQQKYSSFKEGKLQEQLDELNSHIGAEPDEDLDIVEEYAEPVVEEMPVIEESPNPFASSYQDVHSSGDVIAHSMKRSLKSFEDERSLVQTRRNTGLKNRFRSFDTNPIAGLQRNMSELLDTVIKMEEEMPVREPVVAVAPVSQPSQPVQEDVPVSPVISNATLPIQKAQAPTVPKKKMKIKQSRAIDDNKGFYLVDMDDKLALMGRINDKFTVLKKFDDKEKKTLQVRRDKDNLYMVRTDGFKALVDVEDSKMGVLAEL